MRLGPHRSHTRTRAAGRSSPRNRERRALTGDAYSRAVHAAGMTMRCLGILLPSLLALPTLADAPLTGAAAYGDWHSDAPGVVRRFTADDMPPPYTTLSVRHAPSVVARPV